MDWIALAGLVLGGSSLVLHAMRYFRDRRGDTRQNLSDLAMAVIALRDAALALFLSPSDPGAERELRSRLDTVEFLAGRSARADVRAAARALVDEAERFMDRDQRTQPDAATELPAALDAALTAATTTIAARWDELRGVFGS
jgi:hypothetical protein